MLSHVIAHLSDRDTVPPACGPAPQPRLAGSTAVGTESGVAWLRFVPDAPGDEQLWPDDGLPGLVRYTRAP